MKDTSNLLFTTKIKIYDPSSHEMFYNGHNAIHYENMSKALVYGITNSNKGFIYKMVFGNGGATVDSTGIITYLSPNTAGSNAGLYNQTYSKIVDANSNNNRDPSKNYTQFRHVTGANYSDVFISCLLDYGEPEQQLAFDNGTNLESSYIFDELGLVSYDSNEDDQLLLTHVTFHPVLKSLNRLIQIDYTVRIHSLTGEEM